MEIDGKKFPDAVLRNETRVIIPCRIAFVHLDEPWSNNPKENAPKFGLTAIISKEDKKTMEIIRKAEANALELGVKTKFQGKRPYEPKSVIHDGERQQGREGFDDCFYIGASSPANSRPATLNKFKEAIPPTELYSGCYALVSINFYPYNTGGSKGVAAGLNAVLKMYDGERFGGGGDGSKDFDGIEIEADLGNLDDM